MSKITNDNLTRCRSRLKVDFHKQTATFCVELNSTKILGRYTTEMLNTPEFIEIIHNT